MDLQALQTVLMGIADKLAKLPNSTITRGYQQAMATVNVLLTCMDHPDAPEVARMLSEHAAQASFEAKSNRVRDALVRLAASTSVGALGDDG
jgi:hypothetical protein